MNASIVRKIFMGENAEEQSQNRSDFWMKVAGITFGLWSLAIPFGVVLVRDAIREVVASQEKFQYQFNNYVLTMERRVTLIEERQVNVIKRLDNHGVDSETHERDYSAPRYNNGNGKRQ